MNCSKRIHIALTAFCFAGGLSLSTVIVTSVLRADEVQETTPQPRYQRTSYGHEAETLENEHIRLLMFKRLSGWGWGEIRTPTGTHVAVLDHLGEVMLRDQDIPMRLEAEKFPSRESTAEGERLVFDVRSLVVREKLQGTSFDEWMRYPLEQPCLVGQVSVTDAVRPAHHLLTVPAACHRQFLCTATFAVPGCAWEKGRSGRRKRCDLSRSRVGNRRRVVEWHRLVQRPVGDARRATSE